MQLGRGGCSGSGTGAGCAVGMTVRLSSFLHTPPLTPPPLPHPPSASLLCAGSCFLSGPLQAWVWWPLQRGGAEVTSPCSSHGAASWLPVPERPSRGTRPLWLFLGREQDLLEVPQVHCCTGRLHPELSQRPPSSEGDFPCSGWCGEGSLGITLLLFYTNHPKTRPS